MKKIFKGNQKFGFSLMELMVTLIVMGVLAALAIPKFSFSIEKSKLVEGIQIVTAVLSSQIAYNYENQAYADALSDLDVEIPASNNFDAPAVNNAEADLVTVTRTGDLYQLIGGLNAGATVITCDDSAGQAGICQKLGM